MLAETSIHAVGFRMSLVRASRKSIRAISCGSVVICLIALSGLIARSAPHDFARAAIHADSDHRSLFDNDDRQWLASPAVVVWSSLQPAAPAPVLVAAPIAEFLTDGLHYNRPPPTGYFPSARS
jgi:hypothetical protein